MWLLKWFQSSRSKNCTGRYRRAAPGSRLNVKTLGKKLLKRIPGECQLGVVLLQGPICHRIQARTSVLRKNWRSWVWCRYHRDFLPLDTIDPKKLSRQAVLVIRGQTKSPDVLLPQQTPHLFGLVLTNFGFGPNSVYTRFWRTLPG